MRKSRNILRSHYPEYLKNKEIRWNFTKFLINRKGTPIIRFAPTISPDDLEDKIKSLL